MTADVFFCPITACDWTHPVTDSATIEVFEWPGSTSAFILTQMLVSAKIDDDAIAVHLAGHGIVELAIEVTVLQRRLQQVVAMYNSAMGALRAMAAFDSGMRQLRESSGLPQADVAHIRARLLAMADGIRKVSEGNG